MTSYRSEYGKRAGLRLLRPVCYVESNPFCRDIIAHRMADGQTPVGPMYHNIETYKPVRPEEASAVAITAGFPCQGVAGQASKPVLQTLEQA